MKENEKQNPTAAEREKAEREKAEKLKAVREQEAFKRKYFEYYDDIKISHREDW